MSTKFWQTLKPLRKVGKLPYKIDVPAFSVDSGRKSVLRLSYEDVSFVPTIVSADPFSVTTRFTISFWIKPTSEEPNTPGFIICSNGEYGVDSGLALTLLNRRLSIRITTDDTYILSPTTQIASDEWTFVAVTFEPTPSETTNTLKVYINDALDSIFDGADVGEGGVTVEGSLFYWGGATLTDPEKFYLSNFTLWGIPLPARDILKYMHQVPGQFDNNLLLSVTFNEHDGDLPRNLVTGNALHGIDSDNIPYQDEEYPHCHVYNGSFVVGEFVLDSSEDVPFALRYPIRKPDDCTNWFACISWVEENCDCPFPAVKRYQLWHVCAEDCVAVGSVGCGEDVDVFNIPDYNGETIPSGAKIEIWSIDGQLTADLETIQTWLTSVLETVSNSTTTSNTALLTLTSPPDTELFAAFPWTFPVAFNETLIF